MRHNYETAVREALKALVIDAPSQGLPLPHGMLQCSSAREARGSGEDVAGP
jgi:hypothetical protein